MFSSYLPNIMINDSFVIFKWLCYMSIQYEPNEEITFKFSFVFIKSTKQLINNTKYATCYD